ncbi:hypothetical protein MMC26_000208 [Xylographa opegraphella]|nr:hypothetical protein [Xylographa opegraphella]
MSTASTRPTSGGPKSAPSIRKNGQPPHPHPRPPFRPSASLTPYSKRLAARTALAATKAKEKEMKAEKEAGRQERVAAIKDKRARKAERERFERMAETMHRRRVERVRRREGRNRVLKS